MRLNENANISIDFLAAIAVLVLAFIFAVVTIINLMTPYSGYSKELYPTADRAVSLLVEDEGKWESVNTGGYDWENIWEGNESNVLRIGFLENKNTRSLSNIKVSKLMKEGGEKWWEYPNSDVTESELNNASRALGLGRYNFYMQVRPINASIYDESAADSRAVKMVGDGGDVVSVVRYSMLSRFDYGNFDGAYLYGFKDPKNVHPSKPLFGLDNSHFYIIELYNGIKFTITNWTITGANPSIQNIEIGTIIRNNATQPGFRLKGSEFTIWRDDEDPWPVGDNSASINLDLVNKDTNITIFVPVETLDDKIGNWLTADEIYVQLNVAKLEVYDGGVTWFSDTFASDIYAVKTILWVW